MNKIFLLIVSCGLSLSIHSQNYKELTNVSEVVNGIKQFSANTNTIESAFRQEKYLDVMAEKIVSEGKFYFSRPDAIKWVYNKPYQYAILLKNSEVKIKDNEKISTFNVNSNPGFKQINDMMMALVKGDFSSQKDYVPSFFENDQYYKVVLSPKKDNKTDFVQNIQLFFDKNSFDLNRILLNEKSGDYTNIEFINRKVNQSLSADIFNLH